jgi:septum formation protein
MSEMTRMGGRPLVYLASESPQRKAILEELGISYQLLKVDVDEMVAATARETVEENARRKLSAGLFAAKARVAGLPPALRGPGAFGTARSSVPPRSRAAVLRRQEGPHAKGAVVIGADTVLEAQGRLLGKPADETTAIEYLQTLSGGRATAYSAVAVAVVGATTGSLATETAEVHFKTLTPEAIRWYLSTGEPMGRAGAFGISRLGEILTESIDGCYSCVSGLPKTALLAALATVAGGQMPPWLRQMPATLLEAKVQLRPCAVPAGQ